MKKILLWILIVAMVVVLTVGLTGCQSQAQRVSWNVSKEADNFNVTRRVVVFNTRSDKIIQEVIGLISIQHSEGDIDIIIETAPGVYKKHFVGLNEWTTYSVEDISGAFVDKYHYEINFLPEMLVPITFTSND